MGAGDVRTAAEVAQLIGDDSYAVLWLDSLVMVKTPESIVTIALSKFDISRIGLECSTTEELARSIVRLANEPVPDNDES
jgi:hypothetical protein